MKGKKFWEGYQECLKDCQGIIKARANKHGDSVLHYFDCIDNDLKAAFVILNQDYQRLKCKIKTNSTDTAEIRENCRDLVNHTAFLYSLAWNIKEEERIKLEREKLDDYLTREYQGV